MILILDENLTPRWREFFTPFGVEAVHWRDIGTIGAPDETIFDYACDHDAIIVTQDLDFSPASLPYEEHGFPVSFSFESNAPHLKLSVKRCSAFSRTTANNCKTAV